MTRSLAYYTVLFTIINFKIVSLAAHSWYMKYRRLNIHLGFQNRAVVLVIIKIKFCIQYNFKFHVSMFVYGRKKYLIFVYVDNLGYVFHFLHLQADDKSNKVASQLNLLLWTCLDNSDIHYCKNILITQTQQYQAWQTSRLSVSQETITNSDTGPCQNNGC